MQIDEKGKAGLIKGVAKDRRISVEDGQMRHGRKSRSVRVDGYKRHVAGNMRSIAVNVEVGAVGVGRTVGLEPPQPTSSRSSGSSGSSRTPVTPRRCSC